jgi:tetratricopeptide (TPR) repeat protein
MPFGNKEALPASDGNTPKKALVINFDEVYETLIDPALVQAGCMPFRADKEQGAGDIRTDMFFELVTADAVLADISILNANVFYELGIRHGVSPRGVFMIHGGWNRRPFDVAPDRTFDYDGKLLEVAPQDRDDAWQKRRDAEIKKLGESLRGALEVDAQTIGSPLYKELVGLKPVDWSGIQTARAKYFGKVFVEWKSRVEVALLNELPGDILTLAGDAPTRFHRGKLLWEAARGLISMHRFEPAKAVLEELLALEPNNLNALTQLGLVLGRLGKINEAQVHMARVAEEHAGETESQGVLGRIFKDMWRMRWDKSGSSLQQRQKAAVINSAVAADAARSYDAAQHRHLDSYYNGINVISLVTLLDHLKAATGDEPVDCGIVNLSDLIVVVRMAASEALECATKERRHSDAVWTAATLGELELVVGDADKARKLYQRAANTPNVTYFQMDSMLNQVRLIERLGFRADAVTAVVQELEQAMDRFRKPEAKFNKVVVFSGHRIDSPGRKTPRFPPEKEGAVRQRIARQLEEWEIGPGDLAICGGAQGGDMLFAELCADRMAEVWLFLPLPEGDFLEESVRLPNSNWEQRFFDLRARPEVKTFLQSERLGTPPKGTNVFARDNLWILNTAQVETKPRNLYAILVWDEQPTGDGPGGTSDFATRVRRLGGRLAIVNPTQTAEAPAQG